MSDESIRDRWLAAKAELARLQTEEPEAEDKIATAAVVLDEVLGDLLASDEEIEFTLRDAESGATKQIMAKTEKLALKKAREWVREADYGEIESTI
jgi:hypothetical protein